MLYTQLMVAAVFALMPVTIQTPPNFAGVWEIVDITPKPKEGQAGALPPADLTVVQTPDSLSLSTPTPWGDVKTTVYSLDGREDKGLSGAVTRLSRSRWIKTALVTEGRASQVTSAGYDAWTIKETMRLDARDQLIIDRHSVYESGSTFQSQVTYRRKGAAR